MKAEYELRDMPKSKLRDHRLDSFDRVEYRRRGGHRWIKMPRSWMGARTYNDWIASGNNGDIRITV